MRLFQVCLTVVLARSVLSQNVVVTVQGLIRGEPRDGYVSYEGIPYARVFEPSGRFKKAGLAPLWSGTHEPSPPHCLPSSQPDECLRLDVHVPSGGNGPWPVLAWVAGAGRYEPGMMVREGVIVVVVYHRLGPTGFLCLNSELVPGNAGAKDVVLALRWVRDNIVAFRGNPANVIVGGQGFGAAVVESLTLSPMAQGLFHGVIMQSGTALNPSSFNYDAEDRVDLLATRIKDSAFITENIYNLATESERMKVPYFPFGLCVERNVKDERLLNRAPYDQLVDKKVESVPMIIGYNSDEAYIFAANIRAAKVVRRLSNGVRFLLPEELKYRNAREVAQVARLIKEAYFVSNTSMASVLAYHRDAYFLNHIHRSARLHASASHQPVYYYQFSHAGRPGVEAEPGIVKTGASHSDELAYLFAKEAYGGDDGNVQRKLVQLWTDFVKHLNPTPQGPITWEPMEPGSSQPRLLEIGVQPQMRVFPHAENMRLWDDVYEKYYYGRYRV